MERAEVFFLCARRRRRRILDVRTADLQKDMAGQRFSVPPDPTKMAATQRTSPRAERAIEQSAMREQLRASCERRESRADARRSEQGVLSSASDDDGGGFKAPRIARCCPGRTSEQTCFSSVSERGRQRLQSAIRASGASNQTLREQCKKTRCERRESRAAARRRSERRCFFSARDDDGGGFQARCASSARKEGRAA
jgi:hypothetical protein